MCSNSHLICTPSWGRKASSHKLVFCPFSLKVNEVLQLSAPQLHFFTLDFSIFLEKGISTRQRDLIELFIANSRRAHFKMPGSVRVVSGCVCVRHVMLVVLIAHHAGSISRQSYGSSGFVGVSCAICFVSLLAICKSKGCLSVAAFEELKFTGI